MFRNEVWVLVWMYLVSTTAEGPRCPPTATDDQCLEDNSALDEYFFYVNGAKLRLNYGQTYYQFTCLDNVTLEYEWLPRFERAVNVSKVQLTACAPPTRGYAAALRALGVAPRALALTRLPAGKGGASLAAHHLRHLALFELELGALAPLRVDPAFLEPLAGLTVLRLTNVSLAVEAAPVWPLSLRFLSLADVGVAALSAEMFARLPALSYFELNDRLVREIDLRESPALRLATLQAPLAALTLGRSLVNVTLRGVRGAALRGDCSSLRKLVVEGFEEPPPARWLAACGALRELRVSCGRAGSLHADALDGARALRELAVSHCRLAELPPRWLAAAPALEALDLSDNALRALPSELAGAAALRRVQLARNRLDSAALQVLAPMLALEDLSLESNPLGDLCGAGDAATTGDVAPNALSPLWHSRALRSLRLARCDVTRVCRDWRSELPRLAELDLSYNRIPLLEFDDLQWRRDAATLVNLRGNPLSDVLYTRQQFRAVLAGNLSAEFASSPKTTLVLDSLQCACGSYWFARAVQERPGHARAALRGARCAGRGAELARVPPRELTCALPAGGGCPAGCSCRVTGEHSLLHCARAGLRRVPRAPPGLPARELLLAHNNLTNLTLDDFTSDLETLDLSDNLIAGVDAATAAALFGARRSVRLDGNPLRCDCGALPLLRALVADAARRPGRPGPRPACRGGAPVPDAARRLEQSCGPAVWPYALAALALAAASAVVAGCLVRPVARQRFKKFLFERGLCLRWVLRPLREGADEDRPYDAFVSFSHHDEQYAAELARRLEGGCARRLCLHERDWRPGDWIPEQIARSVRSSRRTVVLLSERFLASTWARAELREAYAATLREARPRLLLVLLPGLSARAAAAADPQLRAYIESVTYLRWDDPRFWDKLQLAMPEARAPAAAAPALLPPAERRAPPCA